MNNIKIKEAAEAVIKDNPKKRILSFPWNHSVHWIKRKISNGRSRLVKYSTEKEFNYEVARLSIAAQVQPSLVPSLEVLTSDYIVTEDGGPILADWVESTHISQEEKLHILELAGKGLAELHTSGIVHGRPALRDITYKNGQITFLDWQNRFYFRNAEDRKVQDYLMLLHGIYRENYKDENLFIDAVQKGYTDTAGTDIIKLSKQLLDRYNFIGILAKNVRRFHWTDVDAAGKIFARFAER